MTALSWQYRSGKEQQFRAVAGIACDEIPKPEILTAQFNNPQSPTSTYRAFGEPPSTFRHSIFQGGQTGSEHPG